ncbi:sulfotransferase family 2 domain-containing protein [Amphritea sp. 1_MG-2023]|uniref:sulfotransferase family 2 domain-containing protein n=1 Tax=Amphritea sp. 1_MG-2023 TaxID=3062670 RepID=UPI0026E379B4|nr:sulfotransferase family 2 domain-containing protein [Amphritea sp. 1_MG-2023]MDO6565140.1 sulfotransferase family 2 domain-containing protein [Amphritea sp. 1_MG-2023]
MPYFEKNKILFIHIPKNAGMFIEKSLGIPSEIVHYRKPTDPLSWHKKLRNSFKKITGIEKKKSESVALEKALLHGQFGGPYTYQHASLQEIIDYRMLPLKTLEDSKILSIHRNPFSRTLSIYHYWGFHRKMNFDNFCKDVVAKPEQYLDNFGLLMHLRPQTSYIKNSGSFENKVEWVCFENLEQEFSNFSTRHSIHVDGTGMANKINVSNKSKIHISKTAQEIIKEIYREDFICFDYSDRL